MNKAIETPIDAAQLQKIRPYSRHAWVRGRAFLKPLRQELVHSPADEIDHLGLKIRKCIELSTVFAEPVFTDRLAKRLIHKFGYSRVRAPLMQSMAHQQRFDDAAEWADTLVQDYPDDPWALYDAGNCAILVGDAARAVSTFKTILQMTGDARGVPLKTLVGVLIEAGEIDWLQDTVPSHIADHPIASKAGSFGPVLGDTPIYCISLDQDRNRMNSTAYFLESGGDLRRVRALLGESLPKSVRSYLSPGDVEELSDGEIGCGLSHVATWERVATACEAEEYALVTEDDARFIYGPGVGLQEIKNLACDLNAGLVFVNSRACFEMSRVAGSDNLALYSLQDMMTGPARSKAFRNPGWGADGYLINGKTAAALVESFNTTKLLGAIDWQMFVLCLKDLPDVLDHRLTRNIHKAMNGSGALPSIKGYVSTIPIINCRDFGYSTINTMATK